MQHCGKWQPWTGLGDLTPGFSKAGGDRGPRHEHLRGCMVSWDHARPRRSTRWAQHRQRRQEQHPGTGTTSTRHGGQDARAALGLRKGGSRAPSPRWHPAGAVALPTVPAACSSTVPRRFSGGTEGWQRGAVGGAPTPRASSHSSVASHGSEQGRPGSHRSHPMLEGLCWRNARWLCPLPCPAAMTHVLRWRASRTAAAATVGHGSGTHCAPTPGTPLAPGRCGMAGWGGQSDPAV